MDGIAPIVEELRKTFGQDLWQGPALADVFADVDGRMALYRCPESGRSIWEIAVHLRSWIDRLAAELRGEPVPPQGEQPDWPTIGEPDPAGWDVELEALLESERRLRQEVDQWPAERHDQMIAGKPYTYGILIYALAQHKAHHAIEVAALKRAALASRPD